MDTNIKTLWGEMREKASREWMDRIGSVLVPSMGDKGFKVGSVYAIDPAPGNEFIAVWVFAKDDYYLEVHAHSSNAFSVVGSRGEEQLVWPTSSASLYDRQNYTIGYLLEWISQLKA